MVFPPTLIHRLPVPILEKIILNLHEDRTALSAVLPLVFTSKHFYATLGFKTNNHLYARIFRLCFDFSAPARRLGPVNAPGFSIQLRANYDALKCIRRGDIYADDVLRTFWTAFFMLIENDGKDYCHLDTAGLPEFVDKFICERLYENSINGWPADNEINSLALWLLWLTLTKERLEDQTSIQRAEMIRHVLPYALAPVRYAAYFAPHVHYTIPLPQNATTQLHTITTAHGRYPHYRDGFARTIQLYNINDAELGIPLASIAAKLIYFSHCDVTAVDVPLHLPRNRAHAVQLGLDRVAPTQEDFTELNEHDVAALVPKSTWEWWSEFKDNDEFGRRRTPSAQWDDDWKRLADCTDVFRPIPLTRAHYTPGALCGLWQGQMMFVGDGSYGDIIQTAQMPDSFDDLSVDLIVAPVFMRLREYHCMDVELNQSAPSGDIQNAWFNGPECF